MAKRVFKNKKLVRSILILAGLVIVGFFVWTMLFKRKDILEGQQTAGSTGLTDDELNALTKEILKTYVTCSNNETCIKEEISKYLTPTSRVEPTSTTQFEPTSTPQDTPMSTTEGTATSTTQDTPMSTTEGTATSMPQD